MHVLFLVQMYHGQSDKRTGGSACLSFYIFIALSYTSFAFFVIFMQEAMVTLSFFLLFLDFANLAKGVFTRIWLFM